MRHPWLLLACLSSALHAQTWTCGPAGHAKDATVLRKATTYSSNNPGWDLASPPDTIANGVCRSTKSFFFSVPEPEGNFVVTVVLGGSTRGRTTVKAESRRIMLARVETQPHQSKSETFVLNVRRPEIGGGMEVKLKPREIGALDWDDKLTLEFSGDQPSIRSVSIRPAPASTPTLFLAGDSTVVDQDKEPWAAWGQMLPAFFGPGLAIANHAESGETIRSFEAEQRFAKIIALLKAGDFLMLQFAHNDQKPGKGYVPPEMYAALLRKYIGLARQRGATPILVTSMNRRTFDADGKITDTLAPYPQTMRDVAAEQKVELIDLNAMSKTLYESIGEPQSRSLFVYAAANTYPGQTEPLHDDTHFNAYGAWELARCVVLGLQQDHSPLAAFLRQPKVRFDPTHPDPPQTVALPPTPAIDAEKPYER